MFNLRLGIVCALVALLICSCTHSQTKPVPDGGPGESAGVCKPEPVVVHAEPDQSGYYSAAAWEAQADQIETLNARLQILEALVHEHDERCNCSEPATTQGVVQQQSRTTVKSCRRGPLGRWRCN